MNINKTIAEELNITESKIDSAIDLLNEGMTVPFISRYRKEVTGGLTDEDLRKIEDRYQYLTSLEDRKKTVFASLKELGVEDPDLLSKIENAKTLAVVEDLYRPYKPKKETRASKAKKAGLEPLSVYILKDRSGNLNEEAKRYLCEGYETSEKCIQGACDIIAESIGDDPDYRTFIKNEARKRGVITSTKTKTADSNVYDHYADYSIRVSKIKGYNVLAINRGAKTKNLTKKLELDDDYIIQHICSFRIPSKTPYRDLLEMTVKDAYGRLIKPSIENEIFSELTDKAEEEAVNEFKESLKTALLVPPVKNTRVLGFDPGFSHGCKLAAVDENGKLLDTFVINNPFMNDNSKERAKEAVRKIIRKNKSYTIALGNGTASKESERMLKEIKAEDEFSDLVIVFVSESGASIYSATALAQKEFPDLSPNLRSAVSIARRLQDPLAELVKIPPQSIGVGQYQYDIDEKRLATALGGVVEDVVNYVGVDLNSASVSLLSYVSGISERIAVSIVKYRDEHGLIRSREELHEVPYLGPKAFLNCSGFLRIPESAEYLDNTSVHPESYKAAREIVKEYGGDLNSFREYVSKNNVDYDALSKNTGVGKETLRDIVSELVKPSRDPRTEIVTAKLKEGVDDSKDLKVNEVYEGTIRNITGFGYFVDLGVEISGLVHISEISDTFVSDPHSLHKIGDIVKVRVKDIDLERKRISLTMKGVK